MRPVDGRASSAKVSVVATKSEHQERLNAALRADVLKLILTFRPGEPQTQNGDEVRLGNSGSLAVMVSGPDRGRITDFADTGKGMDPFEFIMKERGGNFSDAVKWAEQWTGMEPPVAKMYDGTGSTRAQKIWAKAKPISPGSMVAKYIANRGIQGTLPGCLRLAEVGYDLGTKEAPNWVNHWSLIVPAFRDGKIARLQAVPVTKDGTKALANPEKKDNGKRTYGKGVSDVPAVFEGGPTVLECEGPEDGIVLWQASGATVRVGLGAGNMGKAPVAPGTLVVIASDNDTTGRRRAWEAGQWHSVGGADVRIAFPPDGIKDWNDQLVAELKAGKSYEEALAAVKAQVDAAIPWSTMEEPPKAKTRKPREEPERQRKIEPNITGRRHSIEVAVGYKPECMDKVEVALLEINAPVFVRGNRLVRPYTATVEASNGRKTTSSALAEHNVASLRLLMDRHIEFTRWDYKANGLVLADSPADVALFMLSNIGEWKYPVVAGVISTPTLRPDGSVLTEDGYDPATRLILTKDKSIDLSAMLIKPTRDDAMQALATLNELLVEFPFVSYVDHAVAVSALISPVVRGALRTVPMHAVRAPTPGSGKSYLLDVASAIASGKPCPVLAAGKTAEENEKRLGAALLEGMPLVSIDNVNGELGGDQLCQMIERPLVRIRPLGKSELVEIESKATVFATGNNLRVTGDMTRRVVLCVLDAGVERPELREFRQPVAPVERVLADRGKYIAAAMTIVRAYELAGSPGRLRDLASFEDWSRRVRSALVWLGMADAADSIETLREDDPERTQAVAAIEALQQMFGVGKEFTARIAADTACEQVNFHFTRPDCREALLVVAGKGGHIDTRMLGEWLKGIRDRPFKGLMVRKSRRGTDRVGANEYVIADT